MEGIVTISKKEYDKLTKDSRKLRALEDGGVNNWEWYSEALKEFWAKEDYE